MPGNKPLVHEAPLFVDVANPMAHAPPSKMRPTWKADTIVDPFENVSGSTCAWWLVARDGLQVGGAKGWVAIVSVAAEAERAGMPTAVTVARAAAAPVRVAQRVQR